VLFPGTAFLLVFICRLQKTLAGLYLQTAENAGLITKVSEEVATEIAKNAVVDNPTVV